MRHVSFSMKPDQYSVETRQPTKATKPPFDGFDSCPSEHIPEKTASNEERRYWWWIWLDGKRVGKVAGGLMSKAEALRSCRATWPNQEVEIE